MANNAIGQANLILGVDSGGFNAGLMRAAGTVSAWAVQLTSKIGFIGAGPIGALVAAGSLVKDAAGAAFDKAKDLLADMIGTVDEVGDLFGTVANSFGMPFERFQELQFATKLSAKELVDTLTTLADATSKALGGNAKAGKIFEQLGVDLEELRGLRPDEVMLKVAEAFEEQGSAVDKTRLAFQLFGAQGHAMLDAMGDGLGEAIELVRSLGLTVSQDSGQSANNAMETWRRVQRILSMMWTAFAVTIAPIYEQVANAIQEVLIVAAPVIRYLIDTTKAWGNVFGNLIGQAWDDLKDFLSGFSGVGDFFKGMDLETITNGIWLVIESIGSGIGWLMDRFQEVANFITTNFSVPVIRAFASILDGMARFIDAVGPEVVDVFIRQIDRLMRTVEGVARLDPTGMLAEQIRGARLDLQIAQRQGNLSSGIRNMADGVRDFADAMGDAATTTPDNQRRIEDFVRRARNRVRETVERDQPLFSAADFQLASQLQDRFRSPMDTMRSSMRDLQRLFTPDGDGLFEGLIDENLFGRGLEEALANAERALGMGQVKFAGAMMEGSKDAASLLYHRGVSTTSSPEQRIERVLERSRQVQEEQARNSRELVDLWRRGGLDFAVVE